MSLGIKRAWLAPLSVRVPGASPYPRGDLAAPPLRRIQAVTRSRLGRQARGADPRVPLPRTAVETPGVVADRVTPELPADAPAPWAVLSPENTVAVDARGRRAAGCRREVAALPAGTWVTVIDDRLLSRWRLRRLARRCGLEIERELIVLPDFAAPLAVVEDVEWAVHQFWRSTASRRPQCHPVPLPAAMAWHGARVLPWQWTGRLATGRVVVARHR